MFCPEEKESTSSLCLDTFQDRLLSAFPHLKCMKESWMLTAVRFMFDIMDLKQDQQLDVNEVGLSLELFYQFNNKFYQMAPLTPQETRVKVFF